MSRDSVPERVGNHLGALLRGSARDGAVGVFDLWRAWNEIVGDDIAKRAQPNGFRNGVLFVTVGSHPWMQELQLMKERLRARLNQRMASEVVRDLHFLAGTVEAPAPKLSPAPPSAAEIELRQSHEIVLPELKDERLADAFGELIEARARRAAAARAQAPIVKPKRRR